LGLRKDFLEHKNRTIESFNLVSSDVSNINVSLVNFRTSFYSMEGRLSEFSDRLHGLRESIGKCAEDISLQKSNELVTSSTIKDMNNSFSKINERLQSFEGKLKNMLPVNKKLSKKITSINNSVNKLLPRYKSQSLKTRRLGSGLRQSNDEIKKIKNLINRKLRTLRRDNSELKSRIKSQRRRIVQLNRKIELRAGIRVTRKRAVKKAPAKKIITKKITPKKTVTTIKTPRRTITKTVTPKKQ